MNKFFVIVALFIFILSFSSCGKKNTASKEQTDSKPEQIETVEYKCTGMHCSGCEDAITEEVKKIDGVKEIKADSKLKTVVVKYAAGKTDKVSISKAINEAGYDTEISESKNKHDCEKEMMN